MFITYQPNPNKKPIMLISTRIRWGPLKTSQSRLEKRLLEGIAEIWTKTFEWHHSSQGWLWDLMSYEQYCANQKIRIKIHQRNRYINDSKSHNRQEATGSGHPFWMTDEDHYRETKHNHHFRQAIAENIKHGRKNKEPIQQTLTASPKTCGLGREWNGKKIKRMGGLAFPIPERVPQRHKRQTNL